MAHSGIRKCRFFSLNAPNGGTTWCSVRRLLLFRGKQFSLGCILPGPRPHSRLRPMLYILDAFLSFWAALQTQQRAAAAAAWGEAGRAASTAQNNTTCRAVTQRWQAANKPGVHVVHQVSGYRQLLWLDGRYFILRSPDTRWHLSVALLLLQTGALLLLLFLSQWGMFTASSAGFFFFFFPFLACRYQIVSSAYLSRCTSCTKPQVKLCRHLVRDKSVTWLDACRQVGRLLRKHQQHQSQTVTAPLWTTATVSISQDSLKKKKSRLQVNLWVTLAGFY